MVDLEIINQAAVATSEALNWAKVFNEIYEYKKLHWNKTRFSICYKGTIMEGRPDFLIDRPKYENNDLTASDILGSIYSKFRQGNHNKIEITGTPPVPVVFELATKMEYLKRTGNLSVKPITFYGNFGKHSYKKIGSPSAGGVLSVFISESKRPTKEQKDLMFVPVDKKGNIKNGRGFFSKKSINKIVEEIMNVVPDTKYKALRLSIQASPKVVSYVAELLTEANIEIQITHFSQALGKEIIMKRIKY